MMRDTLFTASGEVVYMGQPGDTTWADSAYFAGMIHPHSIHSHAYWAPFAWGLLVFALVAVGTLKGRKS